MPQYRLSRLARLDLFEVADYTVDRWGLAQAERYLDSLSHCFALLAQKPGIGRPCDRIRKGYRRLEHEKHVIFYRTDDGGVLVSRILHESMLPSRQAFEDD